MARVSKATAKRTQEKVISARVNGATIKEAAAAAGIQTRSAEKILARPEAKAEIAQRFANAADARAYCHRRTYERIGDLLDNDERWERGVELFNTQAESDAKVAASLMPATPAAGPGLALQINTSQAVTLDEILNPHRPKPEEIS